jgi:Family of unknown function (DUF6121)
MSASWPSAARRPSEDWPSENTASRTGLATSSDSTPRARRTGLAAFATVGYLAALIALWGILSVIADRDVIDYPDAGPLLGPSMAAVACLVTFANALGAVGQANPWPQLIGTAALTAATTVLVASIGYSITRGDFAWMPAAAVHFAIGPFVPGAALLSSLVVAASWAVSRSPGRGSSDSGII